MPNRDQQPGLPKGATIYFMGIGGTGMSSVAGLCLEAGYKVKGSDAGVYPPVSLLLADLGIDVMTPYDTDNLAAANPDLICVANVLSRGHAEVEAMLEAGMPHTSFPALLEDLFLPGRIPLVVTGTHGKTTTCSLLAHVLNELGEDPGFFIGGLPRNFPRSFRLGGGKAFILEGDEYDTAFFDKEPKFLHYAPQFLILNNIEFDHADIYDDVEAIEAEFAKVTKLVQDKRGVIANMDDAGVRRVIATLGIEAEVTRVSTLGESLDRADYGVSSFGASPDGWHAEIRTKTWGTIPVRTGLSGRHNLANISQVVACIGAMEAAGALGKPVDPQAIGEAIASFKSVKRRLDHLASSDGIDIYEDFAHHPTAVEHVIDGFRRVWPDKRLLVAFEPRSAIQRRKIFTADYARILGTADGVYIGELYVDKRIPEDERMDIGVLTAKIGAKARAFASNAELAAALKDDLQAGDAVIFMSSGSFSGVQYQLAEEIRGRPQR